MLDNAAPKDVIKNGSDASFIKDVIEASREAPVLVDFWAPWCGPCRTLTPAIERAVTAARGKVRLVKINIDENPGVAGQLGVRSIPAVFAFSQGRPVDGFVGALPESQLKSFIERLAGGGGGAGIEDVLAAGEEALGAGDVASAAQAFGAVLEVEPDNPKAIAGLARCYLVSGDPQKAREALALAPAAKANDPAILGVRAALELAAEAAGASDLSAALARVEREPNDLQGRFDLAMAYTARGDLQKAANELLAIIERDRAWNEEAARKQLLKLFDAAGPSSDLARQGRRRLSALLFS